MHLDFHSISEAKPGKKWQALFNTHWPAYKEWLMGKSAPDAPDLRACQTQLVEHMPEFFPTYRRLCKLAGDDPIAHRFLTGYAPPPYVTGCAQVVFEREAQLVRNYDFNPELSEGTILHSQWNGKKVLAMGDCLCGVVDGMNSDGLVVSLTFGGRRIVGQGFGIPFILRYVLEFCSTLEEAENALLRIPSHMSYNIMLMDKEGAHRLIQVAPDRKAVVTDLSASTNHQNTIDWPEHAAFTSTLERELYLHEMLTRSNTSVDSVTQEFLRAPLFNRMYSQGFGTVYTAIYHAKERILELRWPDHALQQGIDNFEEGVTKIEYSEKVPMQLQTEGDHDKIQLDYNSAIAAYWEEYGRSWTPGKETALAEMVAHGVPTSKYPNDELLGTIEEETKKRGVIPWEKLSKLWRGTN